MTLPEIEAFLRKNAIPYYTEDREHDDFRDWEDALFRAFLQSLDINELTQIIDKWEQEGARGTLYYKATGVLKSKQRSRNAKISTDTLLKLYTDKKSGKVGMACKELMTRFPKETAESQRRILKAFLMGGIKEMEWAARYLRDHWTRSMTTLVKYRWIKTRNPYLAQVALRHFPDSFILTFQEELAEAAGYVYVCARLARNPEFTLDESRLSTPDYLYALAKSGSDHFDPGNLEAKIEAYLSEDGWISVREIGLILWSLGKLGLPDTIIRLKPRIEERLQKNEEETPFLNLEEPPF